MTNAVYTTSELRDMIVPLLPKHDMASACLFGSYARGEADEASDIDVLLVGNQGFRPLAYSAWPKSFIGFRASG